MEKTGKPEIMIVDDLPDNLRLLVNMLKDRGYRIRALPGGKLAMQAIESKAPDLILLDVSMPEMDGFEVCGRLKADERFKDIPVIFISALTDTQDKLKAFEAGGVDYVTKPFHFEEVNARIEAHLKIQALQRQLAYRNRNLQKIVEAKVKEISDAQHATIRAMTKLAEARDDDTGKHIERIRIFCRILASSLREREDMKEVIDEEYIENIFHASPLHDIGKIAIRDSILLKPGKLDPEEFEIMKTHTVMGARNLELVRREYPGNGFIQMGIKIARSHHEKWDGSGYPDGLSGENIPLSARIMAVADVYDALRSKRVYKDAFPHEKAVEIIRSGKGTHFDPVLVDVFLSLEEEFYKVRSEMNDE